jgi:hypothetical protein
MATRRAGIVEPTVLTQERAAKELGLTPRKFAQMVRDHRIRTDLVGGHRVVTMAEIRRLRGR